MTTYMRLSGGLNQSWMGCLSKTLGKKSNLSVVETSSGSGDWDHETHVKYSLSAESPFSSANLFDSAAFIALSNLWLNQYLYSSYLASPYSLIAGSICILLIEKFDLN